MAIDKVKYWTELADYDIETADAMYQTKRWLYVGFMCHQVIEKMLKAYWVTTQTSNPPYTHSLVKLATESGLRNKLNEQQRLFLSFMMPMNIEARYPEYKESLLKQLTPEVCQDIINKTKDLQQWIKTKL